jgi:hypothetical protein
MAKLMARSLTAERVSSGGANAPNRAQTFGYRPLELADDLAALDRNLTATRLLTRLLAE